MKPLVQRSLLAFAFVFNLLPAASQAAPPASPSPASLATASQNLTLSAAQLAIASVRTKARALQVGATIAVVDAGGSLIALERLDGTFAAGAMVSYGKARTAALFKKPTSFFEDVIRQGRTPMVALDDFTPLQGGVPIIVRGNLLGAIGVSGASSAAQDEEFAIAGANALLSALGAEQIVAGGPS